MGGRGKNGRDRKKCQNPLFDLYPDVITAYKMRRAMMKLKSMSVKPYSSFLISPGLIKTAKEIMNPEGVTIGEWSDWSPFADQTIVMDIETVEANVLADILSPSNEPIDILKKWGYEDDDSKN